MQTLEHFHFDIIPPKFDQPDTGVQENINFPRDPSFEWVREDVDQQIVQYDDLNEAPYLVLLESFDRERNVGRYDPVALGKLISKVIDGERRIFQSGRPQVKIWCSMKDDANKLLTSSILTERGYKVFVPPSLLYKKGIIKILPQYSVSDVIENMDEEERNSIVSARRRNGQPQDIIDLAFSTTHVPRSLYI